MKFRLVVISVFIVIAPFSAMANADPWGQLVWGQGLWSVDAGASANVTLSINKGWNLKGSSVAVSIDTFTGNSVLESIWKWDGGVWAVCIPGESPAGGYAQNKGFKPLVSISPGEGFWVNSKQNTTISVTGPHDYGDLTDIGMGWSLLGVKSAVAITSAYIASTYPKAISIWKWSGSTWAVSLPQQADGGADYANGKQFGLISTLEPGDGFWINCAAEQ